MALGRIYRELLRGKSVGRSLQNDTLAPYLRALSGRVLDLAGGHGSYYASLPARLDVVRTNLEGADEEAVIDMNAPLPYDDASFDGVLLMNALYIAPRPHEVLKEIRRVLAPGGVAYVTVPLVANEMREPHDYWRFTSEGLEHLAREAGFERSEIVPIGERFTAALNLITFGPAQPFALVLTPFALLFDRLLPHGFRRTHPCPLGYLLIARV